MRVSHVIFISPSPNACVIAVSSHCAEVSRKTIVRNAGWAGGSRTEPAHLLATEPKLLEPNVPMQVKTALHARHTTTRTDSDNSHTRGVRQPLTTNASIDQEKAIAEITK